MANKKNAAAKLLEKAAGTPKTEPPKTTKKQSKETAAFTVWVPKDKMEKWKTYQRAKRGTIPTQAAMVEMAMETFMAENPITEQEKAALFEILGL